ncbi:MAG: signal recognition particle-docking protein FtsY, partial [Deltaproteobacteria bacterium]|nr:signal recognition particle-docking protein FtsY [Deltaproteobacteria bacterium]
VIAPPSAPAEVETVQAPMMADESCQPLLQRLKRGLQKTRESFVNRVDSLFFGKKVIDADLLEELEEILITADLGAGMVGELLDEVRQQVDRKMLSEPAALKAVIKEKMRDYLAVNDHKSALEMPEKGPFIILVLGVNGVGKTTTIGKLAGKFKQAGNKVLLVAADTFRAAAIDQIKIWGERTGVEVSAQKPGADPSSVVFDAMEYAAKRDFDIIIVDTAGRLHTKVNLMEELKKIRRVMHKKCPGAPHEVMLVLDATTGQNALSQTKLFNEAVTLSGLTLTKLDGTAKGGIVVNICREFSIPIRFIGVGEQMDDLRDFDAHEFIEALFS